MDVNVVYDKNIFHQKESRGKNTFAERLIHQCLHYRSRIETAASEFNELLEQGNAESLSIVETSRLEELDSFLERAACKQARVPDALKSESVLNDLHRLINKADSLLKEIDDS